MERTLNPVFRSLNRPLLVLGVDRRLFFFLLACCFALFVASSSLVPTLVLFVLLWSGARLATRRDAQFLRIALNSRRLGVRYDPAKFSPRPGRGA